MTKNKKSFAKPHDLILKIYYNMENDKINIHSDCNKNITIIFHIILI